MHQKLDPEVGVTSASDLVHTDSWVIRSRYRALREGGLTLQVDPPVRELDPTAKDPAPNQPPRQPSEPDEEETWLSVKLERFNLATNRLTLQLAIDQVTSTPSGISNPTVEGTVRSVVVSIGDKVSIGHALATVEAMKMDHVMIADATGTVKEVRCQAGDQVETGQVLFVVDPES